MLIDAWDHRILDIITAGEQFGIESGLNPEQGKARDKVFQDLWLAFNDPNVGLFIEYLDPEHNHIGGFAIANTDDMFMQNKVGVINKFYVMPEGRGKGVSRILIQQVVDWLDEQGAVHQYATSTGGIGQNKAFENLLAKVGFVPEGLILKRGIK